MSNSNSGSAGQALQTQILLFDYIVPQQRTDSIEHQNTSAVAVTEVSVTDGAEPDMFGELYFK